MSGCFLSLTWSLTSPYTSDRTHFETFLLLLFIVQSYPFAFVFDLFNGKTRRKTMSAVWKRKISQIARNHFDFLFFIRDTRANSLRIVKRTKPCLHWEHVRIDEKIHLIIRYYEFITAKEKRWITEWQS